MPRRRTVIPALRLYPFYGIMVRAGGGKEAMNDLEKQLKRSGKNVSFERIRRITGYLVGTTDRWNDAKKAELRDRVKHTDRKN
ncbi:anaerobic ribonucleoside-triphosphate reductase [Streptomyces caniscabiei]|uniref:anaerobic ribonucleoside-triphosphate reductase n=1 Tax=Streptomyces caniscabiei TaxID=2746961 RepID=UPI0038F7BFD2